MFPLWSLRMTFKRIIMYTFQKQSFLDVLQKFAKFTRKHQRWSLCNLILKSESSAGVFLWILWSFQNNFRTPPNNSFWLLFRCNSPIKKNLSDISTIGCLVFLDNFPNKRFKLSLHSTLRSQFTFNYLKSQDEGVLSQTFSIHAIFYQDALELW